MAISDLFGDLRNWFPVPRSGRDIRLLRWLLLEGNRYAVTGALLTLTFLMIIAMGLVWPLEMRDLLTETQAVQTVLNSFLGGIILLVSIVVSINSIVLSYDIAPVGTQVERIEGVTKFRREVERFADVEEHPTEPQSFLRVMAIAIKEMAGALEHVDEDAPEEYSTDVAEYIESITETAEQLEDSLREVRGGEYGAFWLGLDMDHGPLMNRMLRLTSTHEGVLTDDEEERFAELMHLFEVFATGREYFKTLYYSHEIADLSRTLLLISLPSIMVTAWTILAINANLFPNDWVFGLPPLLTFVAVTMTISLAPFIVLTAYMLRVATVTLRTASAGSFALRT